MTNKRFICSRVRAFSIFNSPFSIQQSIARELGRLSTSQKKSKKVAAHKLSFGESQF
jgi:hypothetical protein